MFDDELVSVKRAVGTRSMLPMELKHQFTPVIRRSDLRMASSVCDYVSSRETLSILLLELASLELNRMQRVIRFFRDL